MQAYFFDSSALVKRYTIETGTEWVTRLLDPTSGNSVFIARITAVEVVSAIARRAQSGNLSASEKTAALNGFRRELQTIYFPVEIDELLIDDAMRLAEKHALRGYDAVQLAAARGVRRERRALNLSAPTLVSADGSLNAAAVAESLTVDDPNQH